MKDDKTDKITSDHVYKAIKDKFSDPQRYATMSEVNCGTGYAGKSWIDALVISLWPSDGLHRMAFEIKVSRADFLSEMKKHAKNEFFREHCHEFWYATAKGVVKSDDEIPEGCGWMCMRGKNQLVIQKQAQRKADVLNDDLFIASIARSCFNAQGNQREILENEIMNSPNFKSKKAVCEAVRSFIKSRGGGYWNSFDKNKEEVIESLNLATVDKEHRVNAEQIEQNLNNIRTIFSKFLTDILPMAAHTLIDVDDMGSFLVNAYGYSNDDKVYRMLTDLYKSIKKRTSYGNQKKLAKEELKFFEELLKGENKYD